jgi:hypothetical protein
MGKCIHCQTKTDWICERCDQLICEDCAVAYTEKNYVDFTICQPCYDSDKDGYFSKKYKMEKEDKARREIADKKRQRANELARKRYNSPEQKQKRAELKKKRARESLDALTKALDIIMK